MQLNIISEPKKVRATLRAVQETIREQALAENMDVKEAMTQWSHVQELITSMDILRPVNSFEQHDLCTKTCECEKWYR